MAFCTNCGKQLSDDAAFCPNCGTAVGGAPKSEPAKEQNTPLTETWKAPEAPEAPVVAPSNGEDTAIMVKGILAIALCEIGIPGIILGAMAKKGVAAWLASGKPTNGKIKTGSILGKLGFIFGIISTISWSLYILIAMITLIANL